MEIKVHGEMSMAEIKQSLFEKLSEVEDDHAVEEAKRREQEQKRRRGRDDGGRERED